MLALLLPLPLVVIFVLSFFDARPGPTRTDSAELAGFVERTGPAKMVVTVDRLDRNSGRLDLTLSLSAPSELAWLLLDDKASRHVTGPSPDEPGVVVIPKRYRAPRYDFQLALLDRSTSATTYVRFPLAQVFGSGSTRRITVVTTAQPQSFPGDWYVYSGFARVDLPSGLSLFSRYGFHSVLPLAVAVDAGPATRGLSVHAVRTVSGDDSPVLEVWMKTDLSTRVFAYMTASVPLVIVAIAVLLQLMVRRNRARLQEAGWAVALGMLSVLPIRQVVVPQDISTLTRLDLMLGIALISSASGLLYAFSHQLDARPRRRNNARSAVVVRGDKSEVKAEHLKGGPGARGTI